MDINVYTFSYIHVCFTLLHLGTEIVFSVKLETILQGHDSWVHAVQWQPAKLISMYYTLS